MRRTINLAGHCGHQEAHTRAAEFDDDDDDDDDNNNEASTGAELFLSFPFPFFGIFTFIYSVLQKALLSIYDVLTGTGIRTVYTHIHCEKYGYL
jgi:hypothetical protein